MGMACGVWGLSAAIGDALSAVDQLHPLGMILAICLTVTFVTEMTSNTATAALLMPILAGTALAGSMDPRMVMIPATLSASCAFMLPVATAPNAVMYGSGRVPLDRMAREGLLLNLAGAIAISLLCYALLR